MTDQPSQPQTSPSPEDFMAEPYEPDEDDYTGADAEDAPEPVPFVENELGQFVPYQPQPIGLPVAEPLGQIALTLGQLNATVEQFAAAFTPPQDPTEPLKAEIERLEADVYYHRTKAEEVLALCKPSTSKLANAIRAVLSEEPADPEPAEAVEPQGDQPPAEAPGPPADDAPVEEWRAYARSVASPDDEKDWDWSQMNRSQIRTALGIEQPHE